MTMKKQNIIMAGIALAITASIAGYGYSIDQTRQAGFVFGNEISAIQEELTGLQGEFGSHITQWEEGDLTRAELEKFAKSHAQNMEELIARYDALDPPAAFGPSVDVFKLSAESQLESDNEYILWIETGDDAHKIRSDALIQESFEYETAALGKFKRAQLGIEEP